MQMGDLKVCTKCETAKERSEFYKKSASDDGLDYNCRSCKKAYQRAYQEKNADKLKAQHKDYREANADRIKAYKKAYYQEHFDEVNASNRAWNEANADRYTASKKAYHKANADTIIARVKAWSDANPDRSAAIKGKEAAIRRGGSVSDIYDLELCIPFYEEARRLSRETGVKHHVDHIIPIAKGGLHCQENLQVLTATENMSKGDSL
jgi:5-methylcytosine-specific restriction endonuclease McrA